MRRALGFVLLFVSPPFLKPWLLRWIVGARVGQHVSVGWFTTVRGRTIALGDHASIRACTVIRCGGDVRLGRSAEISSFTLVYGAASLALGDHSYIGPQSLINCEEDVRLGHHTALGARAVVYTHGSWLPYTEGYWVRFAPVVLGDYVWCAAGVFLHPGTEIGSQTFVNSRSVVAGVIPGGVVVEGVPARVVAPLERVRRQMTPPRVDAAIREMLLHFVEAELRRTRGLEVEEIADGWRVQTPAARRIVLLASGGPAMPPQPPSGERTLYLVNRPGVRLPDTGPPAMVDFTTSTAATGNDEIFEAFVVFIRRYYGVRMERSGRER